MSERPSCQSGRLLARIIVGGGRETAESEERMGLRIDQGLGLLKPRGSGWLVQSQKRGQGTLAYRWIWLYAGGTWWAVVPDARARYRTRRRGRKVLGTVQTATQQRPVDMWQLAY